MKGLNKAITIGVLAMAFLSIFAPKNSSIIGRMYCDVYFQMENTDRHCYGSVWAECMWWRAPYGNWGVDSNVGSRYDDDQFQGWYPDDGWRQWNSCTDYEWAPPDPSCVSLYNDAYVPLEGCYEQHSPSWLGENGYGGGYRRYEIPRELERFG